MLFLSYHDYFSKACCLCLQSIPRIWSFLTSTITRPSHHHLFLRDINDLNGLPAFALCLLEYSLQSSQRVRLLKGKSDQVTLLPCLLLMSSLMSSLMSFFLTQNKLSNMQWLKGPLWSGPLTPAATTALALFLPHWPPHCSHWPTLHLNTFIMTLPSPWTTLPQDFWIVPVLYVFVQMLPYQTGLP